MIRKWSYLDYNIINNNFFDRTKNSIVSHFPYKIFKKSVKFRKKNLCLKVITKFKKKRLFIRKSRRKAFYFKSFILKDWSSSYQKARQFWRFYQSYGILKCIGPIGYTNTVISLIPNSLTSYSMISISSKNINMFRCYYMYFNNLYLFNNLLNSKHYSLGLRHNSFKNSTDNIGMPLTKADNLYYQINLIPSNVNEVLSSITSIVQLITKLYILNTLECYKTFIKLLLPFTLK